jgi:ABC-type nitrate/sulfonate/bicarbonate transport system permease component
MTSMSTGLGARASRQRARRRRRLDPAPLVTLAGALVAWQIAAQFASQTIIPSIPDVAARMWELISGADTLQDFVYTLARVGFGLVSAFVVGSTIGVLAGAQPTFGRYVLPAVRFVQGIPSLSWVVLAVIWFENVEVRIWFIMLLVTLPGFTMQLHDSYRAIPRELVDMARSFRPGRFALFREVTLPAVTPGIFTAWKVNLGLGIRVVLIAELVGATIGIGAQLLNSQQLFDMTSVVAWTLLLACALLVIQALVELLETRALRYRPPVESDDRVATGGQAA